MPRSTQLWRSLKGYEMMNMIRKGQVKGVEKGDISAQVRFVAQIFAINAQLVIIYTKLLTGISFCNTTLLTAMSKCNTSSRSPSFV